MNGSLPRGNTFNGGEKKITCMSFPDNYVGKNYAAICM